MENNGYICGMSNESNSYNVLVTYRRTSRMSMRIVKNGDVHVSVPIGTSRSDVRAFVERNQSWIAKARERVVECQQRRSSFYDRLPLLTRQQRDDALLRIQSIIPPLVERNAARMGVHPRAISYKPAVSYWGKCNVRTFELIFSYYLLLLPEWCVEQVVVHELAHLLVPNHSPRFHAVMDKYYPRWREARAEIRRHTNLTE